MFSSEKQGTVDVVNCNAPLNSEHISDFNETVDKCLTGQPKLVLDMSGVAVVDSQGIEALLDLQEQLEQLGGAAKLASPGPVCLDALKVTGVGSRFEIFTTVKAAIGSFAR